jgi:hypothetical protein
MSYSFPSASAAIASPNRSQYALNQQDKDITDPSLMIARKLAKIYWRRLIKLGVPIEDAMYIAIAIARFDVANKKPRTKYRNLIGRYCPYICRAELWRPGLLV